MAKIVGQYTRSRAVETTWQMEKLTAIVGRFPMKELKLRRLYAADPDFRDVCEDYSAAICALEYWKDDAKIAEEYRQIVQELEEEILKYI